jgi:predicted nucleotidyltransferase
MSEPGAGRGRGRPALDAQGWAVIRHIAAGYRPQRIIVFGSYARGDVHEGSDLDVLIVQPTAEGVRFTDRIGQVLALCWEVTTALEVQPLIYTPDELARMRSRGNDFICTALAEGVVVYDQPGAHGHDHAAPDWWPVQRAPATGVRAQDADHAARGGAGDAGGGGCEP